MASGLLLIRRNAGFRSARDFAEHINMPLSTYSKYEANPDKIPLKAAWQIADKLNCSIDLVVGRREVDDVEAYKGEIQREYEALSPEGRELMDELRGYVQYRERMAQDRRAADDRRRYDQLFRQYERLMFQEREGEAKFGDVVAFGSAEEKRREFEKFLTKRAREKQKAKNGSKELGQEDMETIAKIMEAYDRAHPTSVPVALLTQDEGMRRRVDLGRRFVEGL